jgi:23S rRNA pseudouridine2605 synthase
MEKDSERLNKYLALRLGISRREADDMIYQGSVSVNSRVAELGSRVTASDIITIAGKAISHEINYKYFLLNKPEGYVCSRRAQGDNATIYDALPAGMTAYKPVGRLDKNSSGILLLSNDGDYAFKMTHPSFQKTKIYLVDLNKALEPLHHQMIADYGIDLEDGKSKFSLEKMDHNSKSWRVTMTEGRNRQIRRTFRALGYEVTKLHRTNFGPYAIGDLKPGDFVEVQAL